MAQVTLRVPATAHSQIYTNSSNVSLAQYGTFTLTGVANVGAIVGILAQRDHNGTLNYPSALYYAAYNKATQIIKSAGASSQMDFGLRTIYDDMLWMGANYRNNGDIGVLLGYSFQERYEIGYVYEMINTEPLKTYAPVTHEFMIAIKFKPATEEELLFYK